MEYEIVEDHVLQQGISSADNHSQPTRLTPQQRQQMFKFAIEEKPIIDLERIRELSKLGLPESSRPMYWRILLGYLPCDRSAWEPFLKEKRKLYSEFHRDLIVNPRLQQEAEEEEKRRKQREALDDDLNGEIREVVLNPLSDHPLSQKSESQWNKYFKDNEMIFEIEKDVQRTFPHLHFFQVVKPEEKNPQGGLDSRNPHAARQSDVMQNQHYKALRNILFMWAKLNPGIAYVQGMNEVLGPIYYTFATDTDENFKVYAEPDAFFCFTQIMSEIMNNFCTTLDHSDMGIKGQMAVLNQMLKKKDFILWKHLESLQLDPQYYSFRWITLLLSQEFDLPDVLRLWDSFFADEKRFAYLLHTCVAMLILTRKELLESGFGEALKILQKYTLSDINDLISLADEVAHDNYKVPIPETTLVEDIKQFTAENKDPIASIIAAANEFSSSWGSKLFGF